MNYQIANLKRLVSWQLHLGLIILPVSPFLAAICFLGMMVNVWRQEFHTIIRRPVNLGFAILAALLLVNACFAQNRGDAFLGLFNFLPFFVLFAAVSAAIETPAQLRRISWAIAFSAVPVIIIGLGQLFWGWTGPIKLWMIIDFPLEPSGTPPGRMASVFAYANVLASYLVITFILTLELWIEQLHKQSFPNLFLSLLVIANALALILTHSRNAWAIAFLSCLAFAVYLGWRWLVTAVTAAAGTVLWAAFGLDPLRQWLRLFVPPYFWKRLTDELHPDRPIAQLRSTQWQFAWDLTLQRPGTGWGLRNFTTIYAEQMHYWVGHPHNLILMLMAETGIIATLWFCGLVGWVLGKAVLLLGEVNNEDKLIFFSYIVAFGGCSLFHLLDVTLFDARINILGWLLLGSIAGMVDNYRGDRMPKEMRMRE